MLLCKNTSIQCAKSTQFLGVIIDDKLRWNDHIIYVNNKILKYLGILYKIRRSLDNTTLTNMYYSLIFPYLIYGVEIWGRFLKLYLDSQVKFRRNASKVQNYFFSEYLAPSELLCQKLNILNFEKLVIQRLSLMMFKKLLD